MTASRWAIVKCKFADDSTDTLPDETYARFFTGAGAGSMGMVDYFLDMSHGQADLSDSRIFGWFTLRTTMDECRRRLIENQHEGRTWIYQTCLQAARDAGFSLDGFVGIVAAMNRGRHAVDGDGVDLWGAGGRVFCDRYALIPSLMGHELGHGYGLGHSRRDGHPGDYQDPWDVMSTQLFTSMQADHPLWGPRSTGPGLNVVNMRIARWFDESRLWYCPDEGFAGRIQLRPLHRPDLPGFLAASLPDPRRPGRRLFAEFRIREKWDAAIPDPVVLVHREESWHSYLVRDLRQGAVLEYSRRGWPNHLRIRVARIDERQRSCDLEVVWDRPTLADRLQGIAGRLSPQLIGAVTRDGAGAVIHPNGTIVPVGPWDPTMPVLRQLSALQAAESIDDPGARRSAERSALAAIAGWATERANSLDRLQSPAPPQPGPKPARRSLAAFLRRLLGGFSRRREASEDFRSGPSDPA